MKHWKLIAYTIVVLFLCGCASTVNKPKDIVKGDYDAVIKYGRELITKTMADNKIAGISVALVSQQDTIWSEGFGWASVEKNIPLSADSSMRLGSVSKLFTAIAIMQLVERGKINLDSPLSLYIPELAPSKYTLREVLSHHAGLVSGYRLDAYLSGSQMAEEEEYKYRDLPSTISKARLPSVSKDVFTYSNIGYSLLGLLVERISGQSFSEYMDYHVFQPLQMHKSSFLYDDRIKPTMAYSIGKSEEQQYDYIRDIPAGALASSANDMALFLQALLSDGGGLTSPASFQEMLIKQNIQKPLDGNFEIGMGFFLNRFSQFGGLSQASHSGKITNFVSSVIALPESSLAIVVMSNNLTNSAIVESISVSILEAAYQAKTGKKIGNPLPKKSPRQLTGKDIASIEGYYASPFGLTKVSKRGHGLKINMFNNDLIMNAFNEGQYSLQYKLFGIFPIPIEKLKKMTLKEVNYQDDIYLNLRFHGQYSGTMAPIATTEISHEWLDLVGEYHVLNDSETPLQEAYLRFDKNSGFLLLGVFGLEYPVKPINETELKIQGVGTHLGDIVRLQDGGSLVYSGLIFQKNEK